MSLSEDEELELLELEEAEYQASKAAAPPMEAGPTKMDSAGRGLAQGASFGLRDEGAGMLNSPTGAVKEIANKFGADFSDEDVAAYRRERDASRVMDEVAKAANPKSFMAGELGGAVATSFVPGMGVARGASLAKGAGGLAKTVGSAAVQGAAYGAGVSNAESIGGLARDSATGFALGSLGGAAGFGLGKGVSSIANSRMVSNLASKVGDKADEVAERLAGRALGAERGTIKKLGEDRVRAAGRYALDNDILSPFASTDDLVSRNNAAQSAAGTEMGKVYSKIDDAGASSFNPLDVAINVEDKVGGFYRSPINRGETKQLENTLESILMRGEKPIPLSEAQLLKEEISKVANWRNSLNITDKEKMAREAYGSISKAIDEAAESGSKRVGVDGLAERLKAAKKTFSNSKAAEELLGNKSAREQGNKFFGITDGLAAGAGIAGAGISGGATLAIPVAKKFGEKYGAQSLALGANRIAELAKQSPQIFGKFSTVMQNAAQRGTQAIGATHFILESSNPEYRAMMKQLQDESGE